MRQLGERLCRALVRREAIKALRAMDDRELRDIGISRSYIEDAVVMGRAIRRSDGCAERCRLRAGAVNSAG